MKSLLINLLEKILYRLTKNEQVVKVIMNPNELIEENIQLKEIERRLPLNVGDTISFESGKNYKVEVHLETKKEINGKTKCFPVRLRRTVENSEATTKQGIIHFQFDSIRELNFYLEQQIHLIENITKNEFYKPYDYLHLTIEQAHEKALIINQEISMLHAKIS